VVFDLQPVKASEAPWCAVISKGDVHLWHRADSHAPFGTRPASSLFGLSTRKSPAGSGPRHLRCDDRGADDPNRTHARQ
jgi:hypothetical protein